MAFEIEKKVKLPPFVGHGNAAKYPFGAMKAGDSFLVNGDADWKKVSTAASAYGKRKAMKFSVRKMPEGYRCWRIA